LVAQQPGGGVSLTGDAMGFDEQQVVLVGQHQENFKVWW